MDPDLFEMRLYSDSHRISVHHEENARKFYNPLAQSEQENQKSNLCSNSQDFQTIKISYQRLNSLMSL